MKSRSAMSAILSAGSHSEMPMPGKIAQDAEDILSLVCWPRGDRFLARGRHCLQLQGNQP